MFQLSPEALLEDSWRVTTAIHRTPRATTNSLRGLLPQGLRPQAPTSPATQECRQRLCVQGAASPCP